MIFRVLQLTLLLLLASCPLAAQRAHSLGSAAALGEAAVTEARRADAGLWNPALVGVYDGPQSSYSLVAPDLRAVPPKDWASPASALGLSGFGLARYPHGAAPSRGPGFGEGSIRWIGTHYRTVAVSISSSEIAAADIPESISRVFGGSPLRGPAADSAMHASYSVVSVTQAAFVGRMPVIGKVWLGGTAKGWVVHSYGRGEFLAGGPGEAAYREVSVRGVPGYGADLGVLAQPLDRVRLGIAFANVAQGAFRPENGPRVRDVEVVEAPEGPEVVETVGPHVGQGDEGTDEGRMASALWSSASFPVVFRAGASYSAEIGSLAVAWRRTLRAGGLDPDWLAASNTIAFAGSPRLPIRLSYAWGGGTRGVAIGLLGGSCERGWAVAVERRVGPWGLTTGGSASVTLGSRSGCDQFRS